ncbi:lethal(2) giant larvae protein homolog 1 isoform X3 [Pseudophryne corroboree]|uniref:lethal(2) giant larvae protein homolog 1 isoform X3 n=1 Tax=Pseudophryne corroboree TaxID=495146 RepID=UPI003081ECAA
MMKFRFRRQGHDPQREKIKQDLFAFNKTVEHGFPNQPSSLAYDPVLRIMAIGAKSGAIKIYGAPGVEFTGLHKDMATVTQMHFLPGQGRLLSLLDDNTLHLWEMQLKDGCSRIEEICSFILPGRPGFDYANSPPSVTHVTVILVAASCDVAALGTEGGGAYFLQIPSLKLLEDETLLQDKVLHSLPDEYRCGKALGPVESLQQHPQHPGKILIGYSRGLVVLWDRESRTVEHLFLGNQQLESLYWESSGMSLISSHSDGGYMVWAMNSHSATTSQPVTSTIPYGPFPCKAINKIQWQSSSSGNHYIIFSGGMPRASYGDRHCVTIMQGKTLVTLDFTSRLIDFFTVCPLQSEDGLDNPIALVVLVEEELVVIDLQTPGWPTVPSPYLAPLHSSAITCSYHISNVTLKLWERILIAGEQQNPQLSSANWPIDGGRSLAEEPSQRGLLLTGHEDGTVRFWDASGVALRPLYKLGTAAIFQTDSDHNDSSNQSGDEDWPPFRKVLVMDLSDEKSDHVINVATVDLLQDREGFTWKGHDRLTPRNGSFFFPPGFQTTMLVQCMPPAAVTAVALHSEWNLVAFGTSHGFGLFDYHRRSSVLARCTLHPNDSLAMEGPLSRVKSLKKSLRQSFRRIRKSRVSGKKRPIPSNPTSRLQEANAHLAEQASPHDLDIAPVQRRIEPRSADDSLSGVVRCLYFADTFLRDAVHHGPTMWAGTNSGSVFAYALDVPSREKFLDRSTEAILGKEIQLMHRAPVVSIAVLDGRGNPLPEPFEVSRDLAKAPDMQGTHSVLIASEEQFKVFTLPKVSAKTKFKLTAHEGCRVRKVALANFTSATSDDYSENCLTCLTNLGDIHVFTVPGLRPQVRYDCIRKEDISGIASCVFTKYGQGFYLISPSEFERFSLSAKNITEPLCLVEFERPHDHAYHSNKDPLSPKNNQANGTHVPRECDGDQRVPEGNSCQYTPAFSPSPLDSPLNSRDTTLDTTGDITVEDVRDLLGTNEESEKNMKNSADEPRPPELLIK